MTILDALEAAEKAATEGPWYLSDTPYSNLIWAAHPQARLTVSHPPLATDATFIALHRNHAAKLIAVARAALDLDTDPHYDIHSTRLHTALAPLIEEVEE